MTSWLVPCAGKRPVVRDWTRIQPDQNLVRAHVARGGSVGELQGIDGRETLDLDVKHTRDGDDLIARFESAVKRELPDVWSRLVVVATPSGGRHYRYCCPDAVEPSRKLAFDRDGHVVAETRGRDSLAMIPPSAGYRLLAGDLEHPPVISADDRARLLAAARALDARPAPSPAPQPAPLRSMVSSASAAWARAALEREAARVAGAQAGTRNTTLNESAFRVGQLAALLDLDEARRALADAAQAAGLPAREASATIESGLAAGQQHPRGPRPQARSGQRFRVDADIDDMFGAGALPAPAIYWGAAIDQIEPPRQLVRGWLVIGGVALLVGPSEAGKSTIAVDLALRVAQHYAVVYVAGEDAGNVRAQIRASELAHGRSRGRIGLTDGPIMLSDEQAVEQFITACMPAQPRLVVIDTLSACAPGVDENSSEMTAIVHQLNRIADELNAAVLVLHHPLKHDAAMYRGHSSMLNNTHTMILAERDRGEDSVTLRVTRHKGPRAEPVALQILVRETDIIDPDDGPISAPYVTPSATVALPADHLTARQRAILEYLADVGVDGGATVTEITRVIVDDFGAKEGSVRRDIASLVRRGLMSAGSRQREPRTITEAGERLVRARKIPSGQAVAGDLFVVNQNLDREVSRSAGAWYAAPAEPIVEADLVEEDPTGEDLVGEDPIEEDPTENLVASNPPLLPRHRVSEPEMIPGARHILGVDAGIQIRLMMDRLAPTLPPGVRLERCDVDGAPSVLGTYVRAVGDRGLAGPPRPGAAGDLADLLRADISRVRSSG